MSPATRMRAMLFGKAGTSASSGGVAPVTKATAFDAGGRGRRLLVIPSSTRTVNSQLATFGRTIQARSRYLCLNDAYFVAAKRAWVSAMVGSGIVPVPRKLPQEIAEALKEAWLDWTDEADATGLTDFYGLQWLAASEQFTVGEAFFRLRARRPEDGLSVPLQMQPIPAEMLPLDDTRLLANGNLVHCGVEFNGIGRRVAYHFLRRHPGETLVTDFRGSEKVRVPADQVIHVFHPQESGQVRGIPHTLPAMVTGAMLGVYDDHELERKRTAAMYTIFVRRPSLGLDEEGRPIFPGAGETATGEAGSTSVPDNGFVLEPGAVLELGDGEEVTPSQPADVGGSYEPFEYRQLTRIAAGLGVLYSDMTGDLRQTSFASMRGGLIQFRRGITALQHHVLAFQMCRRVWRQWVPLAAMAGAIPVSPAAFAASPGRWLGCGWQPPAWEWVDPLNDAQTLALLIDKKIISRDAAIEETGELPEEVDRRIAEGRKRLEELGVPLDAGEGAGVPPGGEDDDDGGEDPDFDGTPPAGWATARLNGGGRLHS